MKVITTIQFLKKKCIIDIIYLIVNAYTIYLMICIKYAGDRWIYILPFLKSNAQNYYLSKVNNLKTLLTFF